MGEMEGAGKRSKMEGEKRREGVEIIYTVNGLFPSFYYSEWQRSLYREQQTMSWLDCTTEKKIVKNVFSKLKFKICTSLSQHQKRKSTSDLVLISNTCDYTLTPGDLVLISYTCDHTRRPGTNQ